MAATSRKFFFQTLLAALCAASNAASNPTLGLQRLVRCPAEFANVVKSLPASPDDPVLTAGPGVQLRTVGFLKDSELQLDSAGQLRFNGTIDGHYSGPHVLLCSDSDHNRPIPFALFIKAASISYTETVDLITAALTEATTAGASATSRPSATVKNVTMHGKASKDASEFAFGFGIGFVVALLVCGAVVSAFACCSFRFVPSRRQQKARIYTGPACAASIDPLFNEV